jgi:DNA-binding beta-propeller fold protein YncE
VNPLSRSEAPTCCWDLLDSNILNCDERLYTKPDATVLIGSFAAQMVWQSSCDDPCLAYHNQPSCLADPNGGRILIGVRGDTSLTYVDVVPTGQANNPNQPAFHCTGGDTVTASMGECDQKVVDTSSSLTIESGDPQAPVTALPDEPYALTLDDARGYLYVGHLVGSTSVQDTGGVSLFDVSGIGFIAAGEFAPAPRFIAPFGSPFAPSSSGLFGVTALNLHEPLGVPPDPTNNQLKQLYVSSRYTPLVTAMVPLGPSICAGDQNDDVLVPSGNTLNSNLVGSEMRGVEFIEPTATSENNYADRAYALQRVPPDLVGFDIAVNNAGGPTATPTDVLETCSSPTFLYQHTVSNSDEGSRLYVNCFDTGEVYVFDPAGPTLLTTFTVGRGPAGMVFDTTRPLAYVLDFSQNDVSVVDIKPQSPTQYHVIQRLGFPSVTPR